jgi:hypothetical protein
MAYWIVSLYSTPCDVESAHIRVVHKFSYLDKLSEIAMYVTLESPCKRESETYLLAFSLESSSKYYQIENRHISDEQSLPSLV